MRIPIRQEMYDAQRTLKERGWEHVASLMHDGPFPVAKGHSEADGQYGLLYARGEQLFWLNKDTIGKLPGGEE